VTESTPTHERGRRFIAVVLLAVSSLALVGAGFLATLRPLAGSPTALADTFVAVATTQSARHAVATKLVDTLEHDLSGTVTASIVRHHALMVLAVEVALADPVAQRLARHDLTVALTAAQSRSGARIDLRPLYYRIMSVMHRVDPAVPARPATLRHGIVTVPHGSVVVHHSRSLLIAEFVLVALGALGVALTAARAVRSAAWRLVAVALGFGVPAALLALIGLGLSEAAHHVTTSTDVTTQIARAGIRHVGSGFTGTAVLFGGLTVAAVGAWALGQGLVNRRRPGVSAPPYIPQPEDLATPTVT
jgi:hypothetical protein